MAKLSDSPIGLQYKATHTILHGPSYDLVKAAGSTSLTALNATLARIDGVVDGHSTDLSAEVRTLIDSLFASPRHQSIDDSSGIKKRRLLVSSGLAPRGSSPRNPTGKLPRERLMRQ